MIKGFSPMWCEWIHTVMSKGSIIVEDNDVVGRYFQTCKGVRQGDPLSPILFNLAVDVLVKLIDRAKVNGQIKGIVPHLVDDGLSIL
jgi:retron-type reverse transcriptase